MTLIALKVLAIALGAALSLWATKMTFLATLSAAIGKPGSVGIATAAAFFAVTCLGLGIVWLGASA